MDSPTPADHLAALRRESRRFRDALAGCDPSAPVPTCPDWDASDLLWHLTTVHDFWAGVVRTRPDPAVEEDEGRGERPASYDELLVSFDRASAALVRELEAADPGETAWTWSEEQTVGFTYRRQAHEALIHRVDAELTADTPVTPLDPALAADGVAECLDVMYGGCPPWGRFEPLPQHVEVRLEDLGGSLWVQLGRFHGTDPEGTTHDLPDLRLVPEPGVAAGAVLSGTAADLDRWLWKRGGEGVALAGDEDVVAHFTGCVSGAIT